jgi:molecular chaperone GrpE
MDRDQNRTESSSDASGDADAKAEASALKKDLVTENDRYLRLAADFDNYRKRIAKESERRAAAQKEAFIRELLPIIDNLERAVRSEASASSDQLLQGVKMTLQQLNRLLHKHGIEPEESDGLQFDPHYHDAIMTRSEPSQPDHVVLETLERGYRQGSESFRPAKVVVNDLSRIKSSGKTNRPDQ